MVTAHIGITGAHHTGKTLLARRIEMELRGSGYTVTRVNGLARRAATLGFPKMTRHTAASTEWIITAGAAAKLEAEASADVVICEHSPADALAYWLAALDHRGDQAELDTLRHLTLLAGALTARNTVLLATTVVAALPLGEHPGKDPDYANERYRQAVDERLHGLLAEQGLDHRLVRVGYEAESVQVAVAATTRALTP